MAGTLRVPEKVPSASEQLRKAVEKAADTLKAAAGHLDGYLEQARAVALAPHLDERPNDFVHVAARAEVSARAGEHDRVDRLVLVQRAERVAQFGVRFEGQGVLPLRPVERDRRHLAGFAPEKVFRIADICGSLHG